MSSRTGIFCSLWSPHVMNLDRNQCKLWNPLLKVNDSKIRLIGQCGIHSVAKAVSTNCTKLVSRFMKSSEQTGRQDRQIKKGTGFSKYHLLTDGWNLALSSWKVLNRLGIKIVKWRRVAGFQASPARRCMNLSISFRSMLLLCRKPQQVCIFVIYKWINVKLMDLVVSTVWLGLWPDGIWWHGLDTNQCAQSCEKNKCHKINQCFTKLDQELNVKRKNPLADQVEAINQLLNIETVLYVYVETCWAECKPGHLKPGWRRKYTGSAFHWTQQIVEALS